MTAQPIPRQGPAPAAESEPATEVDCSQFQEALFEAHLLLRSATPEVLESVLDILQQVLAGTLYPKFARVTPRTLGDALRMTAAIMAERDIWFPGVDAYLPPLVRTVAIQR